MDLGVRSRATVLKSQLHPTNKRDRRKKCGALGLLLG